MLNPGSGNSRPAQGERKWVTVLFADIKGSLALIDQIDSQAACEVLDGTIEVMIESVRRYGGTVNRILGDGVMAVFGAPIAQESHAVLACHAASAILADLEQHIELINRRYGRELQIRVGMSSGEVMVRTVPSHAAIPYDVIGKTAHLASRMEELARPNSVWMTEDTADLTRDFVDLKKIDQVKIKGLSDEIGVFELIKVHPSRNMFDVSLTRGLSQFVGRDEEMDRLDAALADVASGNGRFVTVVGEAGIGKTRLCHEFARQASQQRTDVLRAEGSTYGEGVPWQRLTNLLRSMLDLEGDDKPTIIRRKLRATLGALHVNLSKHEKPLLSTLGALNAKDETWHDLDPRSRRAQIDDAFIALLRRLGQEQPTIILFEDLHKSDSQTLAVLDALCRQLKDCRILILINYRPHFDHRWPVKRAVDEIALSPLGEAQARLLLDGHIGGTSALEMVKDQLIARSEGNPFFLEESLRQLVDVGALDGPPGDLRLSAAMPDLSMPPTVQAAIASQIDRLPFDDKKLLRAAAVVGEVIDVSLLEDIDESSQEEQIETLARLQDLGFIRLLATDPAPAYRFRHALIREVAYQSTAAWQLKTMHRRVVDALDDGGSHPTTDLLATLADHALSAELWVDAYDYAMAVAKRAMDQSACSDALAACEKAKNALQNICDESTKTRQLDLHFIQIDANFASGNHAGVSDLIDETFRLAKNDDDRLPFLRVLSLKSLKAWLDGDMNNAVAVSKQAAQIAAEVGSVDEQIGTEIRSGFYLIGQGRYGEAVDVLEDAVDLIPNDRIDEQFGLTTIPSVAAPAALARALSELSELDRAKKVAGRAMSLARRFNHPFTTLFAAQEVGIVHLRTAQYEKAVQVLNIGRQIADELPPNLLRAAILSELGLAVAELGEHEQGLIFLNEGIQRARDLDLIPQFGQQLGNLARGYFLSGDVGRAAEFADKGLSMTLRYGESGDEAWIRFLIAQIESTLDESRAQHQFAELRQLAYEREMHTLANHCCSQLIH